ncbi:MAG: discoidin domain-containing protein [Thermoanaerobaculia bacterium]
MKRRGLVLLLCGVLAACEVPRSPSVPRGSSAAEEPRNAETPRNASDLDAENLLNLAFGASVVSRTGELLLEQSAVQAIDGMSSTNWASPPGGPAQTMTFALASPSNINELGVTTIGSGPEIPAKVRFEVSTDGKSWREAGVLEPKGVPTPQLLGLTPAVQARYIRVSTIEDKDTFAQFRSVHAYGQPLAPPEPKSLAGCWTINGHQRAFFTQNGSRVTGIVEGEHPTILDGGTDGLVARLMWIRGPMWGYVAITQTPDRQKLTALEFHQEPLIGNAGKAWFGERCSAATPAIPTDTAAAMLRRTQHWSMTDLDPATLDVAASLIRNQPAQNFRVVAYEFRDPDPAQNQKHTADRIAAMRAALTKRGVDLNRIEFVANGSKVTDQEPVFAIQRLIYSRVDLQLR